MGHERIMELQNKPKVLILDLSLKYGGATSRILSLMSRADPETIGLAALQDSFISQEALKLNIPTHIIGQSKTDLGIGRGLAALIDREGYQVLDTQNIQSKFWGSIAAQRKNIALVSTINSWYANEHGKVSLKGKIYTTLELATNSNLDLYITVSENDRQSLLRSNIPNEKIELIYNAVNTNSQNISHNIDLLRRQYSIPQNSIICIAVGRLVAIKGFDILIQTAHLLGKQLKNVHFLIVGDGQCKAELADQVNALGVNKSVTFAGYQDHETVLSFVKSSDIFIMPSRYEGTPIALLEAASLGIPVIASNVGGIPELVQDQVHALLVPPDDPQSLAQAVKRIINDKKLAETLSANAVERIKEKFNIDRQLELTWSAYQKALSFHLQGLKPSTSHQ